MCARGELPFDQLLIEVHHGVPQSLALVRCLEAHGFALFSREENLHGPCCNAACPKSGIAHSELAFVRTASVRRWFERFWSRKACSALFRPLRPPAAPRTSGRPARATVWRFCWSLACFLFSHEFIDASRRDGFRLFDRRSGFGGWSLTAQTSWAGRFDRGGNLCLVKVRGPRWRMPPLAAASTRS